MSHRHPGLHGSAVWLLLACVTAATGVEDPARHAGSHVLVHGPLRIEVMDPAAPERYNHGVRFTPLATVLRATLSGHEFLYNPVEHDAVDDNAGLANEFDLCIPGGPPGDLPPGYAEAEVGAGFLKVGVGVLQKGKQNYNLFQRPRLLVPADTTVAWAASAVQFHQTCVGVDGYAYELSADLAMSDDGLSVAWRLVNTGTAAFTTRHYVHNFFRFDDRNVGPDYVLSFPYAIAPTGLLPEQEADKDGIRFLREIPRWVNIEVPWPAAYGGPNRLTLTNRGNGLAVTCTTSIPGFRTAVHARPQYCSPEQFIAITVPPGEERRWTRSWTFTLSPPARVGD